MNDIDFHYQLCRKK